MHAFRFVRRPSVFLLLALAFVLGACQPKTPELTFNPKPKWAAKKPLDDLKDLPQDATAYLVRDKQDTPLLSSEAAKVRTEVFIERLFGPWRGGSNPAYVRKIAARYLAAYSRNPGYDESGQPRTKAWADRIAWNANLRFFGKLRRPAIVVANTNLRAIPTMDYRFGPPGRPGQGYPFDILQMSAMWVGAPVLVDHVSRDGAWALVECAIAPGWVRTEDLAYVDDQFMSQYLSKPFASIVAEDVPLLPGPGKGLTAGVGATLPVEDSDGVRLKISVPVAGAGQRAETSPVWLTQGQAVLMPMPATPANVAGVLNRIMGQAYGWGGLDGKRDCSAATRDAMAPFGIWLPRNSASQAKTGVFISLEDMTPDQKEQAILEMGVPFGTLIWMPGHILLYIGQYKGLPLAFHDVWGLRTLEPDGSEGRKVIGKAVVTSLRVGEIDPKVGPERILLNRVRGITLLAPEGDARMKAVEPETDAPVEDQ